MDKMDMSLDDIVQMNKSSAGGKMRRRGGWQRGAAGGAGYAATAQQLAARRLLRRQGAPAPLAPPSPAAVISNKILVSNLACGVSEGDVHELFRDFGRLRYAALHHDSAGKTLGTADVIFERPESARAACREYNGVHLDGRPMNIQLAVTDADPGEGRNIGDRIGGGAGSGYFEHDPEDADDGCSGGNWKDSNSNSNDNNNNNNNNNRSGRGGGRNWREKVPSASELDREMDAYRMEGDKARRAMEEG